MPIPDYLMGYVVVVDTETAVLGDHVCEIGFSVFRGGSLAQEWGTFVRPPVSIDPKASDIHKIYDSDVESSPEFSYISGYIETVLKLADVVVAYNYQYDRGVLENEFARLGKSFPLKPMVDPFILFKQFHKFNKGKKLTNAAEVYGIPLLGAHRATNDCTATGKILFKMAATRPAFPKTLDSMIKKQRQWVELQHKDMNKYLSSRGLDLHDEPRYAYYEL